MKDGAFRATFEDKILKSDIVFLRAWVRGPAGPGRRPGPSASLAPLTTNAALFHTASQRIALIRHGLACLIPHPPSLALCTTGESPLHFFGFHIAVSVLIRAF